MDLLFVMIGIAILDIYCLCTMNWKDKNWWNSKNEVEYIRWTRDDIMNMSPYDFELWCADRFKEHGYKIFTTQATNDGGKDLIIEKDGIRTYVEVKQYEDDSITRPLVQKLIGSIVGDGVEHGIFITTSQFNSNANAYLCDVLSNSTIDLQFMDCDEILKFANELYENKCDNIDDTVELNLDLE